AAAAIGAMKPPSDWPTRTRSERLPPIASRTVATYRSIPAVGSLTGRSTETVLLPRSSRRGATRCQYHPRPSAPGMSTKWAIRVSMKADDSMRSRLIKGVAAALVLLVAMTGSYGLWIVYENTLTPAALDQGSAS